MNSAAVYLDDLFEEGTNNGTHTTAKNVGTIGGSGLSSRCRIELSEIKAGETIGSGYFGEVFRAIFRGTHVAVKRISIMVSIFPFYESI